TSSGKTGTNNSFDMGSASSPAIILLQPNGLETLVAGSAYSIQLSSPNLSDGALGILFSSDRGSSWSTVATDLPLSQTSYIVTLPTGINSYNCLIRVGNYDTLTNHWILYDDSNKSFSITTLTLQMVPLTLISQIKQS
ncbi:hypothetical protein, partial [Caldisericum sp.]|uniref:hypothetical protein n=1 Tax=Caldisericum sp. TaxID=2499687 RepID=UPI003D152792